MNDTHPLAMCLWVEQLCLKSYSFFNLFACDSLDILKQKKPYSAIVVTIALRFTLVVGLNIGI